LPWRKKKEREEKEKDRVEKEKDRAAQIRIAEIAAAEKREERLSQQINSLRAGIAELTSQKRQLTMDMLSNKKSKDMTDYLENEIKEIEQEKDIKKAELDSLLSNTK
jgi:hypothetical protein